VNTYAQLQGAAKTRSGAGTNFKLVQGQRPGPIRLPRRGPRNPGYYHVSIANGFNLFQAVFLGGLIKTAEQVVQEPQQALRRELPGQ